MKKFLSKLMRSRGFWIGLIIIVQTVVYVAAGMGKNYIHMDEAYSYGLANYDKTEILDNEDFANQWHTAEYYEDYLVVNEDERWELGAVYDNQRDDVHPPLFYLFLRMMMELTPGEFSVWTGIILNIVIFAINSAFLFLVIEKLLAKEKNRVAKAGILTLAASVTMAAVSTVIYVRMYAMLAMFVTITAYLHLRLLEAKEVRPRLLVLIGLTALAGVLTQYYYLFFLVPVFVFFIVKYVREKDWKKMGAYVGALVVAAIVSLVVWPYSIQHLFFGYRGQGAISNLLNFAQVGTQLGVFAWIVMRYVFHYALPVILIAMAGLAIYDVRRRKKLKVEKGEGEKYKMLLLAVLFFFVVVSVASPYTDIRYLEAACGLIFVVVMVGLYWLVGTVCDEKKRNAIIAIALAVMAVLPVPLRIEPGTEYSKWAEATEFVEEHKEAPLLYIYDVGNNRFLDDILLFTEADWSYVMEREEYTAESFAEVLEGRDLSEGIMVVANYGYDNQEYLDMLKEATGLETQEYIFRLNAADLYYLK